MNEQGWQDIASAPRDGTEILLFLGAPWNRIEQARWFAPWGNWQCGPDPDEGGEYYGIGKKVPTHWMPLPAPPEPGK